MICTRQEREILKRRTKMAGTEEIWSRIEAHQKEKFYLINGGEFTYIVDGGQVILNCTNQKIPKSNIGNALEFVPLINTTPLQKKFRAPSYIYAILMDERIRQNDW
jgi:hypothetical protein